MDSRETTRTPGWKVRWFVRTVAVVVGLVNLRAFVWWFGFPSEGNGPRLLNDGVSFSDALPSVLAVSAAALATSELVLRRSGPGVVSEDYALRYAAAFGALCIGGALAGGLLPALWAVDGTMAADPPAGYFSSPANVLAAAVGSLPAGLQGAAVGSFSSFFEGAVLAFPLASMLGRGRRGRACARPPLGRGVTKRGSTRLRRLT